jgi:uncharacterized membrane protein YgdD (TMEM256/DUF423 family)
MHKGFLRTAAWLAAIAVALGAFGAHGLKKIVPPDTVSSFETGVRYQFYHVIALLVTGILLEKFPGKWLLRAGYAFIIGILLFSGSLYLLTAIKATEQVGVQGVGIITPIGGVFFILGWVCLALGLSKRG